MLIEMLLETGSVHMCAVATYPANSTDVTFVMSVTLFLSYPLAV